MSKALPQRKLLPTLSYIFSILVILYVLIYFGFYRDSNLRYSSFHTSPLIDSQHISAGYTLLAPYNRMVNDDPNFKGKVLLIDMFGRVVHTWTTKRQPLYAVLEKNGRLLVTMEAPKYTKIVPPGGNTGTIDELDWNSQVLWEYKNEMMHHDFVPLPNGNILVSLWEVTPPEVADSVQGGTPNTKLMNTVFSDRIVELDRKGKIVWSWTASEHLDPTVDTIGALMPQFAWTYTNGLAYAPHNPFTGNEAVLVSMRSLNEVLMIQKSDGKILWRSPKGLLNTQHAPTFLDNGNVLVFDNGFTREPNPFPAYGSRAVEINPKTNAVVWKFDGGTGVIDKVRFFAPIVGGAQRLPNGNTLITDGPKGHLFEVTKEKKVVWDMVSPFETKQTGPFPNNFLFKTKRYAADEISWPQKLPAAFNPAEYTIYKILTRIYPD